MNPIKVSRHRQNPRNPCKRVDQQKQAVGIVAGVIEPDGRRVVSYGKLANGDPRTLDRDTIVEIGSITKVFTALVLTVAGSACHSVGTGGFRSFVAYSPKERTGVVVLSNASTHRRCR